MWAVFILKFNVAVVLVFSLRPLRQFYRHSCSLRITHANTVLHKTMSSQHIGGLFDNGYDTNGQMVRLHHKFRRVAKVVLQRTFSLTKRDETI